MSMPTIDIGPIDINNAINNIIASVALIEAGVSHIMNAEGEKLEKMIELAETDQTITIDQIAQINESVGNTVTAIGELEKALAQKLQALIGVTPVLEPPAGGNGA